MRHPAFFLLILPMLATNGAAYLGQQGTISNGGTATAANTQTQPSGAPAPASGGPPVAGAPQPTGGVGTAGTQIGSVVAGGVVDGAATEPVASGVGQAVADLTNGAAAPNIAGGKIPTTAAGVDSAAAVQQQYQAFAQAGDWKSAGALAQSALAQNPGDKNLQALVEQAQANQKTESSFKQRAEELVAGLRGDAGEAPPGSAVAASPLPMGSYGAVVPRGGGSPAAMMAAGLSGREPGLNGADSLVHAAMLKLALRDFEAADALLTRRIAANSSDEAAWRLRALARRWMKSFEPSSKDARSALSLKPDDSRARAVLVDDLVDLGRSRDALDAADAALSARPRDARLLAARADVWASLGEREKQLADLKEAAALDAEFDGLYRQALSAGASGRRGPGSFLLWLGAIGTALLFFSFALFRRRGDSSVRVAMRAEDRATLARAARPEAAPQGFRIERTLGEGGMGVVFEAIDLALQRPVALKKLRPEIADNPRERARFLKEARTVAALRHPNIVSIHAIHEDSEGLFLVFERIEGQTLHERLAAGGLQPAETVGYLRQVAKALDYAHAHGVVHQDLKPANVMISNGEAKVMDFGIARRVAETLSTLSKIEISGTPVYMAPEQEFGQNVGPAADVYALGICAYELLTGRRPFPDGGLMMKTRGLYRPASETGTPVAADAVIARALAPEPGARWPSASSFIEALSRSFAVPA
jgi:tetratricopeptide (TPR) repeat protein